MSTATGFPNAEQDKEEAAYWSAFKEHGAVAAREKLFDRHAGFARSIARRHYHAQTYGDVELPELNQLAYAGLLEAIDRYDPERGVPFRAYATHRISGSLRDGLARMSEVREQISWRHRVRRERMLSLSEDSAGEASRDPAERLAELAAGLAIGFMLEGTGLFVPDEHSDAGQVEPTTAYESLAWRETVAQLNAELSVLPEREQMLLREHYLHGVEFEQLAAILSISKGRVSQLHRSALMLLRKRMAKRGHMKIGR